MTGFYGSPTNVNNGNLEIDFADSASKDSFGRIRVSNPFTIFSSKQLNDNRSIFWCTKLTSGGLSTYDGYRASSTLSVTSTIGSKAIRQTKQRFNYEPGKSYQILHSFRFGTSVSGIRKRTGYFDDNNGIYLQDLSGVLSFNIRSNVTGTPVVNSIIQSNWNLDKLDGTGPSGIVLDSTKVQILSIDFQWLGVGRVRVGFNINGQTYHVHEFLHANNNTSVYMSSPNLPVRGEIENVSATSGSSFEEICSSISFTGSGTDRVGLLFTADRGATVLASVAASIYPLISIRLSYTNSGVTIVPTDISVLCTTSSVYFRWVLLFNPTIAGTDAASWSTVTGSAIQYDVTRSITNTLTGGYVVASGYAADKTSIAVNLDNSLLSLGIDLDGVSDQLVLGVQKIGGGSDSFIGGISWKEFV